MNMHTVAGLHTGIGNLHRAAEKAGRDPASIDISYLWFASPAWTAQHEADGTRRLFTGSRADMLADVAALQKAGARHVIIYPQHPTIEETLDVSAALR